MRGSLSVWACLTVEERRAPNANISHKSNRIHIAVTRPWNSTPATFLRHYPLQSIKYIYYAHFTHPLLVQIKYFTLAPPPPGSS